MNKCFLQLGKGDPNRGLTDLGIEAVKIIEEWNSVRPFTC